MSTYPLPTVRTVAELRGKVSAWRRHGERVALVPTMGALHDGHLSLIRLARRTARRVIVSLFVNPTQFGPNEDFAAYPRHEQQDAALLAKAGCDLLYAPTVEAMYAPGFATSITVGEVSEPLDGATRPGHFAGVATVVTKLLLQTGPDVAVFGEKDFQQLQVIRRLVADLDIPVEVLGGPIVRAEDGLALSSRNAYLTPPERSVAPLLHKALARAARSLQAGTTVARAEAEALDALMAGGFARVDYVEVRRVQDLARLGPGAVKGEARILGAAVLGKTRLIDNLPV
jgi:pantoate--beta-alanine ligase